MNIKEVSQKTNVSSHTIRYYESLGLLKQARNQNHYRIYDENDLFIIKFILVLQYAKFDLKSIKIIKESFYMPPSDACHQKVGSIFEDKVLELSNKILNYQKKLNSSLAYHKHKMQLSMQIR